VWYIVGKSFWIKEFCMKLACFFVKKRGGGPEVRGFSLFRKGCMLTVVLCAFVLLFAGCDALADTLGSNGLGPGNEERKIGEPVPDAADMENIKDKFGVTKEGTDGVKAAFEELSAFIKAGGLTDPNQPDVIRLGDYIDLEGGLTVKAYGGSGENDASMGYFSWDVGQLPIPPPEAGTNGISLLRLIVVGIDSFQTGKGYKGQYKYPAGEKEPPPHVVFQFRNIPVSRRMGPNDMVGGYQNSEMRKYLVPVDTISGSGKFLNGLLEAGVPKTVLWAPARMISTNGSGATKISDLLWLPTEREMFPADAITNGPNSYVNDETNANQARLEYYNKPDDENNSPYFKEYTSNGAREYWLSSANPKRGGFCTVQNSRSWFSDPNPGINYRRGVVPAFCVQ
jgi:hypothetical protein